MAFPEYASYDGLGLAALVREHKITPLELLDAALAAVDRINPRINAVISRFDDRARVAAAAAAALPPDAPFRGVPVLLKDLATPYAGVPLTEGSRFFSSQVPAYDGTLVARYRRAGLVVFGKTNTPELGLVPTTEPALFGPTRNPWDLGLTPGGSSGGSAAAVAAGIAPIAHGGDGGGSLRIPAACCGVFALKPTRGRTPVGPDRSEGWGGFVVEHVITRSVRDSAAMLDATAGPEPTSPYHAPPPRRPFLDEVGAAPGRLRVAVTRKPHLPGQVHPDCIAAVDEAARLLSDLGHDVERRDIEVDPEEFARDFFLLVCVQTAAAIARGEAALGRRPRNGDFEVETQLCAMLGRQHTAVAAAMARERLDALARRVAGFFEGQDLLLSPTNGSPAIPLGSLAPRGVEAFVQSVIARAKLGFILRMPGVVEATVRRVFAFIPFTPLANVTGQPSMTVPLYWNAAGIPVGTMLTARFGDEATLYRVAAQLEEARPWRERRPPVHADAKAEAKPAL